MCSCCQWLCACLASCTGSTVPIEVEAEFADEFCFHLETLSSTAIRVTWGEPSGQYGWYKIRYRRAAGGKWKLAKPEFGVNRHDLTGLKQDTEYEVQIENKSIARELQQYSRSAFTRTWRGTQTEQMRAQRGLHGEARPLLHPGSSS